MTGTYVSFLEIFDTSGFGTIGLEGLHQQTGQGHEGERETEAGEEGSVAVQRVAHLSHSASSDRVRIS